MAFEGHITLDGVPYRLRNNTLPVQSLANQMAPPLGQGTSTYADLTSWSAWIQETWEEGTGKLQPHKKAGTLYSEAESRVPGQLILPGKVKQVDNRDRDGTIADCRYMPDDMAGVWTIGPSPATHSKIAVAFTTSAFDPANLNIYMFWLYARINQGDTLQCEIRNNSSGSPGSTVVTSGSITILEDNEGFYWHGLDVAVGTLAASTTYWLCFFPLTGTMEVAYGTTPAYPTDSKRLSGSTWSATTGQAMMYSSNLWFLRPENPDGTAGGAFFFRFKSSGSGEAGELFLIPGDVLHTYSEANDNFEYDETSIANQEFTVGVPFDGQVYLAVPSGMHLIVENNLNITAGAEAANYFAKGTGMLWKAIGTEIYYSSSPAIDDWTHTPEMTVGDPDWPVTNMAEMNGEMYVASADGLFRIASGDFAVGVAPWDDLHPDNGKSMLNHEGNLYITVNNRIVRYGIDGTFQDVWMSREDDVMDGRLGTVEALATLNGQLIALLGGGKDGHKPTIWAMLGSSWHHIATLPTASRIINEQHNPLRYNMYYDRVTSHLWVITPWRVAYKVYIADQSVNPYNDEDVVYSHSAWVEWDWFLGPIAGARKDFDSISIIGENITATTPVEVYFKDDTSTGWELLGTATSNDTEMRWSIDDGERPDTTKLRLGLLLRTYDGSSTPRIRAIRAKYHTMTKDWFKWSFQVDVSGGEQGPQEGTNAQLSTMTAAEIKASLDDIARAVGPVVYEDIDGQMYEVKVRDATFTYTNFRRNQNTGAKEWEGVYSISVEQATQDVYVAP
jgi:hypothetical protein